MRDAAGMVCGRLDGGGIPFLAAPYGRIHSPTTPLIGSVRRRGACTSAQDAPARFAVGIAVIVHRGKTGRLRRAALERRRPPIAPTT